MGKDKKKRDCPALGRPITSGECGASRHSSIQCTDDCPFNPFTPANYDQLLELEERIDRHIVQRLVQAGVNPSEMVGPAEAPRDESNPDISLHSRFVREIFVEPRAGGAALFSEWEAGGFAGLKKNDERVLAGCKARLSAILVEVRQVLNSESVLATDLLAPPGTAPIRIVDRCLAAEALRFDAYAGFAYAAPHFWRISGPMMRLPEKGGLDFREVARILLDHVSAPDGGDAARRWLRGHFQQFSRTLEASLRAVQHDRYATFNVRHMEARYELRGSLESCLADLESQAGVEREPLEPEDREAGWDHAFVWLDTDQPDTDFGVGERVLGRVLASAAGFRVVASGVPDPERLRQAFEAALGPKVGLQGAKSRDLGAELRADLPEFDASLVPAQLRSEGRGVSVSQSRISADLFNDEAEDPDALVERTMLQQFLQTRLPALDDRTPAEAAREPELRPRLTALVKAQVRDHDRRNRESRSLGDINWMIRELGLDEIDVPPPPPRKPTATVAGRERAAPPPLPKRPLEPAEIDRREREMVRQLPEIDDAFDELEASGSELVDQLAEFAPDELSDEFCDLLEVLAVRAWFTLVPVGSLAPELDFTRIDSSLADAMATIGETLERGADKSFLDSVCDEPALLRSLAGETIARLEDELDDLEDPRVGADFMVVTLILGALINEIVRVVGRR